MHRQMEREEEALDRDLAEGRISQKEYNREMRELQRDYAGAAEEAAQDAYRAELDRW